MPETMVVIEKELQMQPGRICKKIRREKLREKLPIERG